MALNQSIDAALDLNNIRRTLVRLEETIIFSLVERAQFVRNPRIYEKGAFEQLSSEDSFLGWLLFQTEETHAKFRRYESPDETPFHPRSSLPPAILPPLVYPNLLHPNDVNVNPAIFAFYTQSIVPAICARRTPSVPGMALSDDAGDDDGNYGSAATRDVEALQAISRRIHYGKFVSESKFRSSPSDFVPHILDPNPEALASLITKPAVEAALLRRLHKKAALYGQELDESGNPVGAATQDAKLAAEVVVDMYEKFVIPLTKDVELNERRVEVEYLLHRLDGLSRAEVEALAGSR